MYVSTRLCKQPRIFSKHCQKHCVCVCTRVVPGFSPPATELDLNNGGERGEREGEKNESEVKETSRTVEKSKTTACKDKEKKERRFWLPPWYNVW